MLLASTQAYAFSYETIVLRQSLCDREGSSAQDIYDYYKQGMPPTALERLVKPTTDRNAKVASAAFLRLIKEVYAGEFSSRKEAYERGWAQCMDAHPID